MLNFPKNPQPHINTDLSVPPKNTISMERREEIIREMIKIIEENKRIVEEFERSTGETLRK
jgi:hypothetical protein